MKFRHGAVALIAACLFTGAETAQADVSAACGGQDEAAVVCLVNAARASLGLRELRVHPLMADAAERYARRMARDGFFDHFDPQGAGPAERLLASGYGSRRADRSWTAGEALGQATGAYADPKTIVYSWLASSGHRKILLGRRYKHVGVGIAEAAVGLGELPERTYVFYAGRR
jgi:uncharacterized protein YkwD